MAPSKTVAAPAQTSITSLLDASQTLKASKALLSHIKKTAVEKSEAAPKKSLLDDPEAETPSSISETPVWLVLTTKRHISDTSRLQPSKISLPHSLNTSEWSTICLITADPQRAYKDIVASGDFPPELAKRITRIISLSKLKAKYSQYEAQRKLFSEHDIFLGDDRIINRLPKILGKTFYKSTAKRPIPVQLQSKAPRGPDGKRGKRVKTEGNINAGTPKEIAAEIEKALSSALVNLSPSANTAIRVGYANWSADKVVANVTTVVNSLVEKFVPQKWNNVRSLMIKGPETASLPIYQTQELWLEGKDVVADESEEAKALKAAQTANTSKKRKAITGASESTEATDKAEDKEPVTKKAKAAAAAAAVAAENETKALNSKIADRKTKLKKAKAKAVKAMD
ncbi:electron transfer flavoprotein alpha-subunit [Ceratocystis lukuohia]|uniref:Electron transfer flavoprotein alpha-subunit n=1 Tax=Ceratocystis lukuohia TaxID=2019550 RepID=A0ABR4MFQ2_9PEZI